MDPKEWQMEPRIGLEYTPYLSINVRDERSCGDAETQLCSRQLIVTPKERISRPRH